MCGRYVIVTEIKKIEKRFNVSAFDTKLYRPSFNVSHGDIAPIITQNDPKELSFCQFGFTPHWAKKQYYQINARSEGDKNKENDPNYKGRKGIFDKPMFRKSIRSGRCLVVADCFFEGPEKERLNKPYVVYLKDDHPFTFAGIRDEWVNTDTGEVVNSFAIITAPRNTLMEKIGHHRSPVIIPEEQRDVWLNPQSDVAAISELMRPYPADLMNAYPVSPEIKNPSSNGRELLDPIGERVDPEYDIEVLRTIKLEGMGRKLPNERRADNGAEGGSEQLDLFD
jgi:putative SOS response-associated peptidase YedK